MTPNSDSIMGLSLLDLNRPAEAAPQFTEAIRLNPQDPKNHYRLAVACARQHQSKQAIEHYRQTLQLYPEFPEASAS